MKKHLINFDKQIKLNDANSISVEDLISNLRKKFDSDVESLGPFKYLMEHVVNLSKRINEGGKILDITLLDHIIVSPQFDYFSYADEGRL